MNISTCSTTITSVLQAAIRIDSEVTYERTSKAHQKASDVAGAVRAIDNVKKKLRFEQDLVSVIRAHQLPKEAAPDAFVTH